MRLILSAYGCIFMRMRIDTCTWQAKGGVSEVAEDELHEMLRKNPAMRILDVREESEV